MRVVLDHEFGAAFRARLAALNELEVVVAPAPGTLSALADAQALWHVLTPVTEAMIEAAPRLRLIQKVGVGVNTIALDAAAARGIAVCNMPGTNTQAVIETTLLLMLSALRRAPVLDRATRAGLWADIPEAALDRASEIAGRVVGLVGFGAVAAGLAPVLQALGAEVIAWNRTPKAAPGIAFHTLDDVLARADIVSLHVPQTPETTGLLSARRIAAMKPGAVLVNTARGGLVDEAALVDALRSGHLSAAGLDVFAAEPVAPDHPLLRLPNVALMPHVAWRTTQTLERSLAVAADNTRRLMQGAPLLHRVV
jgi:phosphoglycerate dehydrogenase-like enzyme